MKKFLFLWVALIATLNMSAAVTHMTCAEAAEAAKSLGHNTPGTDSVAVTGYVTSTDGKISRNQQIFWLDDKKGTTKTFESYWCNVPTGESALNVGDKVVVKGYLMRYNNVYEIKNGDITILERASGVYSTYFQDNNETGAKSTADYDVATGVLTVDLASNFNNQWNAQVKLRHNIAFNSQAKYVLSMKLRADKDVKNITIKMDDEGEALYENQSINLTAGEDYVYTSQAVQGVAGNNKLLVFDFGYAQAGTHITISDISIKEQTFAYTLNETDKIAAITDLLDKTLSEWDIPETIEGTDGTIYKVTSIAEDAMYQCTNLTSVTIPRYVTRIGYGALAGCTSLTKITWNAIACSGIWDSYYGYSIYCKSNLISGPTEDIRAQITSFIIGDEVEYLPSGLCKNMTNLTSITIPASVKYIGEEFDNTGISSVVWNANVGDRCKSPYKESYMQPSGDDYLRHTYLPFRNIAKQITSFSINEDIDSIPQGLCYAMINLPSVNIPKDVKYIGDGAFNGCEKVIDITLGDKVTYIGASAFSGTNISSVTIPEGVTYMGNSVFGNTLNLKSVVWNVRALQGDDYYREYYYDDDDNNNWTLIFYNAPVTSFTFGGNVDSIPSRLCYGMSQLTSVVVPDNVTLIGSKAFAKTGIQSVTFPERLQKLGGNVCSNTPLNTIVWNVRNLEDDNNYSEGRFGNVSSQITSFLFGNNVETIPNSLCKDMNQLTAITIPSSVSRIGNEAFAGTSISSITIPEGVKSVGYDICAGTPVTTIVWNAVSAHTDGERLFNSIAENITSFTLGDKVTFIPYNLCWRMEKLTGIVIPTTVDSIETSAFARCENLTSIVIDGNLAYMGHEVFAFCTNLRKIEIKNAIKECGAYCFMGCTALDTLIASANLLEILPTSSDYNSYLPKNIHYIKVVGGELSDNAFDNINRNYKVLRTLDLAAATNISLADEAFKGCYNLETLALPNAVEEIPYMMAAECVSLKSVTIPAATKVIGHRAFENCRLLKDVQFTADGQLATIGNWAFYNCHELQSIAIPEGVTGVGYAAFYGCTYLKDISLPSTVESIADNGFALCTKLNKMTVNAPVPPSVEAKTFEDVDRSIPVYVPLQAVPQYKAAEVWKEFNIQGVATDATAADLQDGINHGKILRNGQVLILRNGKTYTITGIEVE